MAVIETWLKQDLKKPVKVHSVAGNLFSQDNMGNLIGVELMYEGEAASVYGTVSANVLRADGATVAVSGMLNENKASVVLPQAAYAVPGMASVVIKLTDSGTVTTIGAVQAIVYRSSTDTAVDPGAIIPDIQALIEEMEDVRDSIPTDYSELSQQVSTNTTDIGTLQETLNDMVDVVNHKLIIDI